MAGSGSLFFFLLMALASCLDGQTLGGPMHGKAVVCYVASWAAYRPGHGAFTIGDLEPSLCTHLVYAFAGLDEATGGIKSLDAWQDLPNDYGKDGYNRMVGLKTRYPHLKVTIAIGGWNEGSEKYSKMAADPGRRAKFIRSVMTFLGTYKFDGLDLDWEYPTKRGGLPEDKNNFVLLVKELKAAFQERGYILTAALGASPATMGAAYDLAKLGPHFDLIHMMCYDYHGTWDRMVGANAPLRSSADELSVEHTIKYMIAQGVSPYKLVLGLAMYGRTFMLQDPEVRDIEYGRTPAKEQGFQGPFTKENGFMGYNEICAETTNKSARWTHHWHAQSGTPYLRDGARVVSYDNGRSIAMKVKMAVDHGLGGLMVWSIDTDDFRGDCANETDPYADFVRRYDEMADDPRMRKALPALNLPESNHRTLAKRSFYTVQNGRLHLRLPQPETSNYNLMRTINEAATLALEEKRILDELDRVTKMNEIDDAAKPGAGCGLASSVAVVVFCALSGMF